MVRPGFARWFVRRGRALCALSPLALLASPVPAQILGGTGSVTGVVVARETGHPLSYSTVAIPALGRQLFTTDSGTFLFTDLPAGRTTFRVRHLGYGPAELVVNIRPGRTDTVRVTLTHIVVQLSPVQVHADGECIAPGVPTATDDSAFLTVFDQLRLNAEQYRLLTSAYPYRTLTERRLGHTLVSGRRETDSVDTLVIDSRLRWKYRPGDVLSRSSHGPYGTGTLMLNIPTIAQFADPDFLDNHCFYNGGIETVDGVELLRVDFVAAVRIRRPDVSGSMYLDPRTFQIRRSVIRLSRIPREVAGLMGTEAITIFEEALPSVPVIAGITSVNKLDVNPRSRDATAFMNEQQTLLRVDFVNGKPGDDLRRVRAHQQHEQ